MRRCMLPLVTVTLLLRNGVCSMNMFPAWSRINLQYIPKGLCSVIFLNSDLLNKWLRMVHEHIYLVMSNKM